MKELFQQIRALPWEEWIPLDGRFVVNGSSVKSKLSRRTRLPSRWPKRPSSKSCARPMPSNALPRAARFNDIKVSLLRDESDGHPRYDGRGACLSAAISSTPSPRADQGNHCRRYGAAFLLEAGPHPGGSLLRQWHTIAIEAALLGRNIAPGLSRTFAAQEWEAIEAGLWKEEKTKAFAAADWELPLEIYASDIDPQAVAAARENAVEAGVEDAISFSVGDAAQLEAQGKEGGIIITNPPYGQRIGEQKEMDRLYAGLAGFLRRNPTWSMFVITADKSAEHKLFGRSADRRRKLFNGRLEVCFYQYHGQKPKDPGTKRRWMRWTSGSISG